MKSRKILESRIGDMRVTLEEISVEVAHAMPHDYGLSRSAWRYGARMLDTRSIDEALSILDARAERCIERRDFDSAKRWRAVMAAVHAIGEAGSPDLSAQ